MIASCKMLFGGISFKPDHNLGINNKLKQVIKILNHTNGTSLSSISFPIIAVKPHKKTQIWICMYAFCFSFKIILIWLSLYTKPDNLITTIFW